MRRSLHAAALTAAIGFGLAATGSGAPVPKDAVAGPLPPPTKEQFAAAENNLKQIGLAFHSYHDTTGRLPNNIYAKDGTPLLSWRVHLLPFIEETPVYQRLKLDEPWDSDTNKKMIEHMPKLYAPIR